MVERTSVTRPQSRSWAATSAVRGSRNAIAPDFSFQRTLASRYGSLGIPWLLCAGLQATVSRRRHRARDRAATRFPATNNSKPTRAYQEPPDPRAERTMGPPLGKRSGPGPALGLARRQPLGGCALNRVARARSIAWISR